VSAADLIRDAAADLVQEAAAMVLFLERDGRARQRWRLWVRERERW
jgi:hypothetical protein